MEFPKGFDDKKFELVLDATPTSTESIVAKKDQVSEALTGLDEEEQKLGKREVIRVINEIIKFYDVMKDISIEEYE